MHVSSLPRQYKDSYYFIIKSMLLFSRLENFNLLLGNLPKLFKFSPVSFFNYPIYFLYNIFKDAIITNNNKNVYHSIQCDFIKKRNVSTAHIGKRISFLSFIKRIIYKIFAIELLSERIAP